MSDAGVEARTRMSVDVMIEKYVKLRDKKKEIADAYAVQVAPFDDAMDRLEGYMLEALNQSGLTSMKSAHGTAYKSMRTSAKVVDWPETLAYIKENNAWDLLEARVSKLAAQQIITETKRPIPGVETSSETCVNVRRASATSTSNDKE
jgi:hypothetical protein